MKLSLRRAPMILPQYARGGSASLPLWKKLALGTALVFFTAFYGACFAIFSSTLLLELAIPVVLLALLVIWTLPDAMTGPVRLMGWLFFSFMIGLVLWPDYLAIAFPGLPWITVRRLISVPLFIVLLICISVSSRTRAVIGETLRADPVLTRLFLAFVALQFLTLTLSNDISVSIDKLIISQLYWTTLFFAGCYVFRQPGTVERWAAIFCLMLVPLTILGLMEWRQSQVPWASHIPSFLKIEDENVLRILAGQSRAGTGIYRVQTTFTTSLGYAEYMALVSPFLVHFAVGKFRPLVRLAALAGLPVTFGMIILTDSRLGAAGFMLSLVFYVGVWAAVRWRHDPKSVFGPAITLGYPALFAAFLAATVFIGRLHRMVWGGGEHQASTDAREEQYRQGFRILMQNPFGYGIGRGAERLGYRNGAEVLTIDTYYLLVALEYGIIGFLIYYGMLIWGSAKAGLRLMSGPIVDREMFFLMPIMISLANFVVIKSVFSQEANHSIVFILLAMILGLLARPRGLSPAVQHQD